MSHTDTAGRAPRASRSVNVLSRRNLLRVAGMGAAMVPFGTASARVPDTDAQLPELVDEWRSICADVDKASAVIADRSISEDTPAFAAAEEAIDEACDRRSDFIERLADTPLHSWAGIAFKLSVAATIISEGANYDPEDVITLSAHGDASRLIEPTASLSDRVQR